MVRYTGRETRDHSFSDEVARPFQAALDNPHQFAVEAVNIVKTKLADQLVDGIKYTKGGTWYEKTLFKDEIENVWLD